MEHKAMLKGESSVEMLNSPVVDFYEGRSIFITGATGFMGKVLVQKLLKNCPKLDKIYLLIRSKRDCLAEARLKNLLEAPIFADIPDSILTKVVAVQGDITFPGLGISQENEKRLIETVSVIFHSAATVKFDEELTKSVQMNVEGTSLVVELARKMHNLAAFIHTSTAYSHCYIEHIEEKFYPCTYMSPDTVIDLCRTSKHLEAFTQALNYPVVTKEVINDHPNTYTFTKALAEHLLMETAADLPLAIIRPSIVVAAWKDPMPGWVDNLNGPTGMITGAASGILHSMMVTPNNLADIIPVDVAINLMCIVASMLGSKNEVNSSDEVKKIIPIYNCTSGGINPITWNELKYKIIEGFKKYPFERMIWFPSVIYQTSAWCHRFCQLTMHRIPALVIDAGLRISGHQPFMGKIISKMEKATATLEFFSTRQWTWDTNNMEDLEKSLQPEDRKIFGLDIKSINWDEYMMSYVYGARHYAMKGNPETIGASRNKGVILYRAHQALVFVLLLAGLSILSLMDPFDVQGKFFFNCVLSFLFTAMITGFNFY